MRKLLIAEIAVCFLPAVVLLGIGCLLALVQLYAFFDGQPIAFSLFGIVFCGACGTLALAQTLRWLLGATNEIERPMFVCVGIVLGLVPVLIFAFSEGDEWWRLVTALPLFATAHIVILSRRSLFRWVGKGHARA